ncbi:MAG: hypothetical protein Q7U18_01760 [Methylobacter sp.]|nr:hypothetical protein [Methylobacter sp.]
MRSRFTAYALHNVSFPRSGVGMPSERDGVSVMPELSGYI